ncbi:uncharacterized protein MYCFIDRAFT_180409 [Pseudocercospora fijiensis CIRAD86]|uniref:Uncharacterized protein n=1 Tax=Pseudocercospora fijiensis (strain CIRAD86) TaxID=383855 RepID=M2ZY83_PSEFD|nr:uncharacterized protein MYCFIDRAFT_180409 [Pseudocercospora fijiensis CIRAD86]EME77076.1 hypothetical protein MYCFIDRAFT_180409 [Pseudocercospora fijiensis CIRAD86]
MGAVVDDASFGAQHATPNRSHNRMPQRKHEDQTSGPFDGQDRLVETTAVYQRRTSPGINAASARLYCEQESRSIAKIWADLDNPMNSTIVGASNVKFTSRVRYRPEREPMLLTIVGCCASLRTVRMELISILQVVVLNFQMAFCEAFSTPKLSSLEEGASKKSDTKALNTEALTKYQRRKPQTAAHYSLAHITTLPVHLRMSRYLPAMLSTCLQPSPEPTSRSFQMVIRNQVRNGGKESREAFSTLLAKRMIRRFGLLDGFWIACDTLVRATSNVGAPRLQLSAWAEMEHIVHSRSQISGEHPSFCGHCPSDLPVRLQAHMDRTYHSHLSMEKVSQGRSIASNGTQDIPSCNMESGPPLLGATHRGQDPGVALLEYLPSNLRNQYAVASEASLVVVIMSNQRPQSFCAKRKLSVSARCFTISYVYAYAETLSSGFKRKNLLGSRQLEFLDLLAFWETKFHGESGLDCAIEGKSIMPSWVLVPLGNIQAKYQNHLGILERTPIDNDFDPDRRHRNPGRKIFRYSLSAVSLELRNSHSIHPDDQTLDLGRKPLRQHLSVTSDRISADEYSHEESPEDEHYAIMRRGIRPPLGFMRSSGFTCYRVLSLSLISYDARHVSRSHEQFVVFLTPLHCHMYSYSQLFQSYATIAKNRKESTQKPFIPARINQLHDSRILQLKPHMEELVTYH